MLKWLQILKNIEKVKLPRWYGFSFKNIKNIELHIFGDASSCAYGTVAYFRFIQEDNVKCIFIDLKSRLVPLSQKPSILRLELQVAVIATRLKNTIVIKIPIEKRNTFLWTDLKIVLNYLNNNDTNFGVYIAHQINEIRQQTQAIGATSKQNEAQLIIPHVIKISYPYHEMTPGYLDRHFLRKNHALK